MFRAGKFINPYMVSADHNFDRYYSLMATANVLYNANGENKPKKLNIGNSDIVPVLSALSRYAVKYMLVGGMAVVFHGYIRTTLDINLWVKYEPLNLHKLLSAVKEMDVTAAEDLADGQSVEQHTIIPFARNDFSLDIRYELKLLKARDFDSCYKRAVQAEIENVCFQVIHLNDLLEEKAYTGTLKDRLDVQELLKPTN